MCDTHDDERASSPTVSPRSQCAHCGSIRKHYFLTPANGTSRKTRTGSASQRRVWKCADCRKQFSVLTGTIFHGTRIPVRTWVFVIFEMCASKNGVAAREIERKYNLTPKSAWYMMHRIREAMKREPMAAFSPVASSLTRHSSVAYRATATAGLGPVGAASKARPTRHPSWR